MKKRKGIEFTPELNAEIQARIKIRPDAPNTQPGDVGNGHVLVVDSTHQKFNGNMYFRIADGCYARNIKPKRMKFLHVDVCEFHCGEVPKCYHIHHEHRKPDGSFDKDENNIEWLRLMTPSEHITYHNKNGVLLEKTCEWCGKPFTTPSFPQKYCSDKCKQAQRNYKRKTKTDANTRRRLEELGDADIAEYQPTQPVVEKKTVARLKSTVVLRNCPICGRSFKANVRQDVISCGDPKCISIITKVGRAQRRVKDQQREFNKGLRTFENKELKIKIRCLLIDGEPWFVGRDVARSLGYKNTRDALSKHVEPEDKQTIDLTKIDLAGVAQRDSCSDATFKPASLTVIINLAGMLDLISKSQLPAAKAIKYWIFHTVLPKLFGMNMYLAMTEAPLALAAPVEPINITPAD